MTLFHDALASVDFLTQASLAAREQFASIGRVAEFEKGHVFWTSGTPPRELVVLVDGEVETVNRDEDGREFIDRFLGPGECVGLVSALDGFPHPQDARVVRDGTFYVVERDAFLRFLDEHPDLRTEIMAMVGRLYRRSLVDREEIAMRHVDERLARFLIEQACMRQTDGARILLHATHSEIAAHLGSVREVVARAFASFATRGLVERTPHGIFVADWDGLREQAGLAPGRGQPPAQFSGATSPELHTRRFFMAMLDRKQSHDKADDAGMCLEDLQDLAQCRDLGCPAAIEAGGRGVR